MIQVYENSRDTSVGRLDYLQRSVSQISSVFFESRFRELSAMRGKAFHQSENNFTLEESANLKIKKNFLFDPEFFDIAISQSRC